MIAYGASVLLFGTVVVVQALIRKWSEQYDRITQEFFHPDTANQ